MAIILSSRQRKYVDWFWLMVVNFMWATQAPVIKLIGDRLGPVAIAFVPMLLSTLLFLPVLWWDNRRHGRPMRWEWADARHFIVAGSLGFFLVQLTYTLGAQRTLAANAAILTLTIPVLVAVAASIMLHERLTAVRVLGFMLALAGVLLTSLADFRGADLGARYLAGNLLFLTACAGSAFYNTYCKLLIDRHYSELEILVYTSVVASVMSLPLLIWLEPHSLRAVMDLNSGAVWGILELALFVYGISMLLFFSILKRLDVTQATLSNYVLPFFIGLLAVVVLKESITLPMAVGGVVILLSTLAVTVYETEILNWLARRKAREAA
jgi:drug/metabolite transporter (DMT)-like permease